MADMHLLHGAILEMQSGDILGHECMGVVESGMSGSAFDHDAHR